MNWAKENKFLAGYIGVMVIGVGALGFKVFTASGALAAAEDAYTTKASAYDNLRRVKPYPSRQNLAEFETQKKEAADVISAFQADLAKREFPVEPISPIEFQDRLKKAVTDARAKATAANIKLPDKFYLGFDRYETAPPDKDAAAALGRQLKAIEWAVNQFFTAPIVELKGLDRPELPEEKGRAASGPAARGTGGNRGGQAGRNQPGNQLGNQAGAKSDLVTSHEFTISLISRERQFSSALNALINTSAPQFYIPRAIKVTNSNQKGPAKVDMVVATPAPDPNNLTAAAVAPAATVPGADPAAPADQDLTYIVGEELIEVTLRIEIVDFTVPKTADAAKPNAPNAKPKAPATR